MLAGYYFSQYNGICYSDFSYLYVILPLVGFVMVGMRCLLKSKTNPYMIGWWALCISTALFFVINVLYTDRQTEINFVSKIEDVASAGYRSPASVMFKVDGQWVNLLVRNEIPIKEKLKKGPVSISGSYKKGLSSSIMIVDWQTSNGLP